MKNEKSIFWIAPIVVMAIGVLPMPYGYYSLSRLVVCGCAIYFAIASKNQNQDVFIWVFGALAVLYNPIIPVHLYEKEIWMIVNLATAAVFFFKRDLLSKADD
jgi:hypothetical protein